MVLSELLKPVLISPSSNPPLKSPGCMEAVLADSVPTLCRTPASSPSSTPSAAALGLRGCPSSTELLGLLLLRKVQHGPTLTPLTFYFSLCSLSLICEVEACYNQGSSSKTDGDNVEKLELWLLLFSSRGRPLKG